jgi:hypothetical protein
MLLCWVQCFQVSQTQVLPGLPLEVLVTTPSDILEGSNPNILLSGRDTITVGEDSVL